MAAVAPSESSWNKGTGILAMRTVKDRAASYFRTYRFLGMAAISAISYKEAVRLNRETLFLQHFLCFLTNNCHYGTHCLCYCELIFCATSH